MIISKLFSFLRLSSRWSAIALGLAIPLSTALDNVLLGLLLVLVLSSNSRSIWHSIRYNSVARACALLFAALLLGTAYGNAAPTEAINTLGKYADLAMVPLLMVAMHTTATRQRVMLGFLTAMLITAVLSWLIGFHVLPAAKWMWRGCLPENPAIFRSSITQSILMAYAAYLLALQARAMHQAKFKYVLMGLAMLTAGNVLFMVQSKTGYLILLALVAYFIWATLARNLSGRGRKIGWREGMAVNFMALLLVIGAYKMSPRLHERVNLAIAEFSAWKLHARNDASTDLRMEFYYNTFSLIKQYPLFGVGTGGFPAAYAQQMQGKAVMLTRNPHNEYLLITVQIGLAGLVVLLYLFYTQWQQAAKLAGPYQQDAARGLLLSIALASLFNSPLLDHTEGLFFAFMSALWFVDLGSRAQSNAIDHA